MHTAPSGGVYRGEVHMIGQRALMTAVALCVAAGFASNADAQALVKGKTVTVKGCVALSPPPCKRLGGYVVNAAVPGVPTTEYIVVTGKVTDHSGVCLGQRLTDITWKPAKGSCPGGDSVSTSGPGRRPQAE
jgi:hypothetical protein